MIRPAREQDIPEILALIQELADYERAPEEAVATAEQIQHKTIPKIITRKKEYRYNKKKIPQSRETKSRIQKAITNTQKKKQNSKKTDKRQNRKNERKGNRKTKETKTQKTTTKKYKSTNR